MDFIWVIFAFGCGLMVRLLALPPLIGYLAAGFLLNYLGVQPAEGLQTLADLGITLMLFTIGLKLNPRDLLKVEVYGGSITHILLWTLLVGAVSLGLATLAVAHFASLDASGALLLAFACSFSSTVCIVKLLEENGEMKTRHGQIAIGILVFQDIVAVLFLVVSTGLQPSPFIAGLLLLIPARPLLYHLLDKAGHGELLPLTGFFLALGGYELFSLLDIKGDLGALAAGMLLSQHAKAAELSKALLSFKDLFLIGFFLSIGFVALPDAQMVFSALLLSLLLPIKLLLFFAIFVGLRLRARSSYLSALALTNFSEFGLIVAVLCVEAGWLEKQWLVILALAVAFSFVLTSLVYPSAHRFYRLHRDTIKRFEHPRRLPEDIVQQPVGAEILVIGLGRVGKGAFDALFQAVGDRVWGMDADASRIRRQQTEGLRVFRGDGEDADLWENLDISSVRLVLLACPSIEDNVNIAGQLHGAKFPGQIAAIARYEDERDALLAAGIDKVFNFYTEAGSGFAEESLAMMAEPT
jgi:glutathione-regulated potassium-efflux system ancillary protein KefC